MSAFVVGKRHIDALVTVALSGPSGVNAARYGTPWYPPYWDGEPIRADRADELGRALWAQNVRSVRYRYPDVGDDYADIPGPIDLTPMDVLEYTYPLLHPVALGLGAVFKAIGCYCYQACEDPGWLTSPEHELMVDLEHTLVVYVPGYAEADWEVVSA